MNVSFCNVANSYSIFLSKNLEVNFILLERLSNRPNQVYAVFFCILFIDEVIEHTFVMCTRAFFVCIPYPPVLLFPKSRHHIIFALQNNIIQLYPGYLLIQNQLYNQNTGIQCTQSDEEKAYITCYLQLRLHYLTCCL